MKKRKQSANGGKPVTVSQLKKILKPAFADIDRRFDIMETRFEMSDRRYIGLNVRTESLEKSVSNLEKSVGNLEKSVDNLEKSVQNLDEKTERRDDALSRAIVGLEKNMETQFNKVFNHIDAFMKRTEANERETLFLGKQHDDLAKYCTEKIAYPTYGRNL